MKRMEITETRFKEKKLGKELPRQSNHGRHRCPVYLLPDELLASGESVGLNALLHELGLNMGVTLSGSTRACLDGRSPDAERCAAPNS
jgi:hypothetical protein